MSAFEILSHGKARRVKRVLRNRAPMLVAVSMTSDFKRPCTHRGNRFGWSVEGVPTLAVVTRNSEPKRQPSFFARPHQSSSVESSRCHWRMLSMAETTRLAGTPTRANAEPMTCSCSGSTSLFRGPLTSSRNQPNRPCRPTRQAAGPARVFPEVNGAAASIDGAAISAEAILPRPAEATDRVDPVCRYLKRCRLRPLATVGALTVGAQQKRIRDGQADGLGGGHVD
jgi:hypothetical protein